MKLAIELVGWLGAALIVAAYLLLSLRRLDGRSAAYHLLNIAGAVGFIVNSGYNGAMPSVGTNVVWLVIGLVGLSRSLKRSEKGDEIAEL